MTIGYSLVNMVEMARDDLESPTLHSKRSEFKLYDLGLKISAFSWLLLCYLENKGAGPVDLLGSLHL